MGHNSSPKGKKMIKALTGPKHTRTSKASFVLFGLTFNHARAKKIALFGQFKIVSATFMGFKIVSNAAKFFGRGRVRCSPFAEVQDNLFNLTLIK